METKIYAAIDIGSNAARLLIKKITPSKKAGDAPTRDKLLFFRYPLRLGDDVFSTGEITEDRKHKMRDMVTGFQSFMKLFKVDKYSAVATSALRDAKNGKEIVKYIEDETGLKIKIINGKEEAQIIYENHIEQTNATTDLTAYVDVGGGSTEITCIAGGAIVERKSYNIGTIRMQHQTEKQNAKVLDKMAADMKELAAKYPGGVTMEGSGGNINKLHKLSKITTKKNEVKKLPVDVLQKLYNELGALTVEERKATYSLRDDRADVIVPAARLFLNVAHALGASEIEVPSLGLADGLVDQMYRKYAERCRK